MSCKLKKWHDVAVLAKVVYNWHDIAVLAKIFYNQYYRQLWLMNIGACNEGKSWYADQIVLTLEAAQDYWAL